MMMRLGAPLGLLLLLALAVLLWRYHTDRPITPKKRTPGDRGPRVDSSPVPAVSEDPRQGAEDRPLRPGSCRPKESWTGSGGVPGPDGTWDFTQDPYHSEFESLELAGFSLGEMRLVGGNRVIVVQPFLQEFVPADPGKPRTFENGGWRLPRWMANQFYLRLTCTVHPSLPGTAGKAVRKLCLEEALSFRLFRRLAWGKLREEWPAGVGVSRSSGLLLDPTSSKEDTSLGQPLHPAMRFSTTVCVFGLLAHMEDGSIWEVEAYWDAETITGGADRHVARTRPYPIALDGDSDQAPAADPEAALWEVELQAAEYGRDWQRAEALAAERLIRDPRSTRAHHARATALRELGRYHDAWDAMQQLVILQEQAAPTAVDLQELEANRASRDYLWRLATGEEKPPQRFTYAELEAKGELHGHDDDASHQDCKACAREKEEDR